MPSKLEYRVLVWALVLCAEAAAAQDASNVLDSVAPRDCALFKDKTSEAMQSHLNGPEDSVLLSLLVEAVHLQCAAIGAIPAPERPDEESARSATSVPERNEADRLTTEARYLVETAMQIDPDAANALLRRLLGPRPGEEG